VAEPFNELETDVKCPTCNVDLTMSERLGIEIDYCPKCRGVWLDRGELDKVIERVETAGNSSGQPAVQGAAGAAAFPPPNPRRGDGDDDLDDDDDRRPYGDQRQQHYPRRRSFWTEMFDF